MNTLKTRVIALLLCLCMVVSIVPMSAFATETNDETVPTEVVEVVEETTEKATEAQAAETVKYTVSHYLWNWDANDYVLLETEELAGIPGELTNAQEKAYEGCILEDDIVQAEILEDGTTDVAVYYIELLEEAATYIETDLYNTSVSNGYFKVISANTYTLAPGAVEHEIVLNNAEGNDRKVAHVFAVDTKNEDLEVMPGYYGIDKLNPDDLAGDKDKGVWTDKQLTQTVQYYENVLGYNVVGAMNTALAYDSNAPYGYMVWNGVVLGTPEIHKGAKTYLAIDWEGNVELRSMSESLKGNEKTAIPANFGWLVKDGKLADYPNEERTSSDASRSMVGVKADGTLIFCLVDGRNGAVSSGLSNYEMGEMMLALGCVNAFNGDGGGSSTFISKRAGESVNTMRSVPSDGSERATINSVILVSTAGATGIFDKALIETEYDYVAPTASMAFSVTGLDTKNFAMDVPAEVIYQVVEEGMGTIENGVYTAGNATGTATIQAVYNGVVVGEKVLNIVHPEVFGYTAETTALPLGKSMELDLKATYGDDDWNVCIDGSYTMELTGETYGSTLNGNVMTSANDPAIEFKTTTVKVTYNPDPSKTDTIDVMFGEATVVVWNFEDADRAGFMGFEEAKQWSIDNNVANTLIGSDPLAGQFNEYLSSKTAIVTAENGKVRNGQYALAWTLDNTDTNFANWSYNVLFNIGEKVVLRDTANGMNATALGMWLYIPEGAEGLAFQSQLWATEAATGSTGCKQAHFMFTTVSGVRKNLNSCTAADIPANRWVYASIDLTPYSYCSTMDPQETATNSRSPSFIRTYVKPNSPAIHTFYIDDIALDYSSAVDDRIAPVIGELQYATQDETKPVEGVTIAANAATFSATVSDNTSLNNSSAKIYIDGNLVGAQVQGKSMFTTEAVVMDNGTHVVTFEISDKMGNEFQTSARFTVAADEEKGLVYLTGHNDSGAAAESGSVYYIDIKTSDIAQFKNAELNIKLNNANTWELEQAPVADGISIEYEVLSHDDRYATFAMTSDIHSVDNVAVITITKTDDCALTGEQTLVSLPVRLWSWDGYDYVNNQPIDPLANKPIVTIDYNVLFGCAETVSGEVVSFGGNATVATKMNATDAKLHAHDAGLTVLNQAATCTANGYENRTYCQTCQSVIDWGTKIEAKGHTYEVANGSLACDCGAAMSGAGVVSVNGKLYYLIGEKLQTGWNAAANEGSVTKWCYADPTTMEVQSGKFTVDGLTYTADENGVVVTGAWVEDYLGKKYSFGPEFYTRCWVTIDGEEYYFAEKTGYALTGYHTIPDNRNNPNSPVRWYHFGEDGKLIERMTLTGVLDTGNGLYYMEEGCRVFAGMVQVGDDYYCVADKTGVVLTGYNWVGSYIMANSKNPMPTGYYEFGADGKMLQGIVVKEDGTYYYEMGKTVDAGWVKDGNDYYVFTNGGKAMTGRQWVGTYLTQTSKNPYKSGTFIFTADGKLANGVVEVDDDWYYCVNGVAKEAGLVCIDGLYYYADANGKLATGRIWVGTYPSHGLLPCGYYEFGANGLMLSGIVLKENGTYYYEMGKPVDTGWLKVGEDYYVFTNGGKALTGLNWVGTYLTQTSRDPYMKGNFYFTEDGKLAGGIVQKDDGWYYYEKGVAKAAGMIKIGDDYYLAESNGKLATGRVWVGTYAMSISKNPLAVGYYEFGTDGKMLQGVVEKDDGLYYYDLGNAQYKGLIERDGEYYYVNEGGKLEIGRVWVGTYASNGILAASYREFGEDGAMLNGFEQLADGLYYYNNGNAMYIGLKVIDGDLYYIEEGGKVMTGKVYVGTYASNGLLPRGTYTFAEDGKFVK